MLRRKLSYESTYKWTAIGLKALRRALSENGFNEIVPAILSKELEPGAFHFIEIALISYS